MALRTKILSFLFVVSAVVSLCSETAVGQTVVDKTVAVVSDAARRQLITHSDVLWQLALQPGVSLDPPSRADKEQALQTLINQRVIALEAERLPRSQPTEKEIEAEITRLLNFFPSPAVFEARLKRVGFDSVRDEAFARLIAQRLAIEKYIDFRFTSFIVITPEEEERYYRDVFLPDFRRRSPGVVIPTPEEARSRVRETLTRQKLAGAIETFLDEAKRRVNVEMLLPLEPGS